MLSLHALPDDWKLNALWDTERSSNFTAFYRDYLVDGSGNYLTDESGNRLVAVYSQTISPQKLNALPDDWKLNSE
jgi:hypothetical protein